jgi:hypothetical protein
MQNRTSEAMGWLVLAVLLVIAGVGRAAIVDVTVSSDASRIEVGQKTMLTVKARVRPGTGHAVKDGIFAWGIDLRLSDVTVGSGTTDTPDPDILGLPDKANIADGWDQAGSRGTRKAWGLEAIWDTQFTQQTRGLGQEVTLFTVELEGKAVGTARVALSGNPIQGDDFMTHQGFNDDEGAFESASTQIEVVPEPASLTLLFGGMAWAVKRRRDP